MDDQSQPQAGKVIVLHPDAQSILDELERLRTELSMLVLERDDLLLQECPSIEMAYMLAIGHLEYSVFELDCDVRKLRRQIDLYQAYLNREEKIDVAAVQHTLDAEFIDFQKRLNEHLRQVNDAIERSHGDFLTEVDAKELKSLYRSIVKALHPDLHPDITEEQLRLFRHAIEAFAAGNLFELRVISQMAMIGDATWTAENGRAALTLERERLIVLIADVREMISGIRSTFPYTAKALLQDQAWVATREDELNARVRDLTALRDNLQIRARSMVGR